MRKGMIEREGEERIAFRLAHLFTEVEIDRCEMSIDRSLYLNMELLEADSPFRWFIESEQPALAAALG